MMKNGNGYNLIIGAARDYDMTFDQVQDIYHRSSDLLKFYENLEMYIEIRRKRKRKHLKEN